MEKNGRKRMVRGENGYNKGGCFEGNECMKEGG